MIKLLAKNYSQAVAYLRDKLNLEMAENDLQLTKSKPSAMEYARNAVNGGAKALIIVGNVGDSCSFFAETFNLQMFYDKFAERNILQYCKLAHLDVPPQYAMDKLCVAPETFNHYASSYGYQCACYGEYNKCNVFFVPDDARECAVVYDNYLYKILFREGSSSLKYVFKVFGLSQRDVLARLNCLPRNVSRQCETSNLDTKIVITFPPKCLKSFVKDTLDKFKLQFGEYIYSAQDKSLPQTLVELLTSLNKTVSTAESVTGGLIASSIVDIPGASAVLYESVVTYSISSKCKRLGINPHYIDEYGVVSQQVAQAMAEGLRKNGSDIAISITGIAGPKSEDGLPVGLCFIGIATEKGVTVYKNIFAGDRNSIRSQAANMAMYFAYKTLTK